MACDRNREEEYREAYEERNNSTWEKRKENKMWCHVLLTSGDN